MSKLLDVDSKSLFEPVAPGLTCEGHLNDHALQVLVELDQIRLHLDKMVVAAGVDDLRDKCADQRLNLALEVEKGSLVQN